MPRNIKKRETDINFAIGLNEGNEWSVEHLTNIKDFVKNIKRTPEQRLKNEMKAIQFQMEEYLNTIDRSDVISISIFVGSYLNVLKLTFKKFALALDTTDGNLKKYLSGERRFSTDLAMKFAHFFHTSPDIWLKIQLKNELIELTSQENTKAYNKYDYQRVVKLAS